MGLTLILCIGFIVPSCDDFNPGIDCDCDPYRYFDINSISNLRFYEDFNLGEQIFPSDTIPIANFDAIYIDLDADYHATIQRQFDWTFSLINTSNACTCAVGWDGSKNERLVDLQVITLNDFDNDHLANSSINDLIDFQGRFFNQTDIPLNEFITNQTEPLAHEDFLLKLKKAPELNSEFKVKIVVELSTGEEYEIESLPIIIVP